MVDVRLKDLTKIFGGSRGEKVVAVDHINLHVKDGEFLTLLGPSGCGKTTTLRMIAGLEVPTFGEIYIGGELVNNVHPKDRDVAMVFQSYALYPHMTVYDNLAFPLKIRKLPKDEIDRNVKEVAELLQIKHLLNRKPKELSGGEQQRTALGRAIIRRPKVFLLDEPLSNLDAKLRVLMRAELKRLQKELKITTIYVTHDQVEAMTMSDRIAVMNLGRIMQVGTPHNIFNNPANVFVAGFIGSPPTNFIECDFIESNGSFILDSGFFKYTLPRELGILIKDANVSKVILGIRPQHIIVKREKIVNGIKASIYVVEPLGTETILTLKLDDFMIKAVVPPTFQGSIGDEVWLRFREDRIMLFDKVSKNSLYNAVAEKVKAQ